MSLQGCLEDLQRAWHLVSPLVLLLFAPLILPALHPHSEVVLLCQILGEAED